MISHLSGVLDHIEGERVVVDVNGIGYFVNVSSSFLASSPRVGEKVKIHTFQVVREDDISLFGFASKEERNLFSTLLSVNGIGPKGAMSIISSVPLDKLVSAITRGNVDLITSVKGIGTKTAQKLIIELKEKVARAFALEPASIISGIPSEDASLKDAISALITLGYSAGEARSAIDKAGADLSEKPGAEELIRKALKCLG